MSNLLSRHPVFSLGLLLTLTGLVFLILENTFYQQVDEQGVLHESLFLPLGALCLCIGVFVVLVWGIVKIIKNIRAK